MVKSQWLALTASLFLIIAFAAVSMAEPSTAPTGKASVHAQKTVTVYGCPKGCETVSLKPGKCPCGATLKKVKAVKGYVCEHCNTVSEKPGKCSDCKMTMTKGTYLYMCPKCHMTSTKPGKCPSCKVDLKAKIINPKK